MLFHISTGLQVPFTVGDKVDLAVKALQKQYIGIIGLQNLPAKIGPPSATTLYNLTKTQLTDIAAFIGRACSAPVRWMEISYNLNNVDPDPNTFEMTDLRIGLVLKVGAIPINGQNIINGLMASPLGYIINQIPSGGYPNDAYIIGDRELGTFHYTQTISTVTLPEKRVKTSDIIAQFGTEQQAITTFTNEFLLNVKSKMEQGYINQGIDVTMISAEILEAKFNKQLMVLPPYLRAEYCDFYIKFKIVFDSSIQLQGSPIEPFTILAIAFAIALIAGTLAAIVVGLPALFEWLKSMTTQSATSQYKEYGYVVDAEGNPILDEDGNPITYLKKEGTETWTNPDLGGIFSLGTIALIAGGVILFLLLMFLRKPTED